MNGRPIAEAPHNTEILVLDHNGRFRIARYATLWKPNADYTPPPVWQDGAGAMLWPIRWWPLPSKGKAV